jgi:glycosyltransferase involved in cell wall biosynthesis
VPEKQVLFIALSFPPAGGAGVQRSAKFVKYLPQFGWRPVVLTLKRPVVRQRDETLRREIPPDTAIVGTQTFEPYPDSHPVHRALVSLFHTLLTIPDAANLWWPYALPAALKELDRRPIRAIFATGHPFSAHLLGAVLKVTTGLPLVLDYRDEWTLDGLRSLNLSPHRRRFLFIERMQHRWAVRMADKVLLVSDSARRAFDTTFGPSDRFVVVRNGYDDADFAQPELPDLDAHRFNIVYTGSTTEIKSRPKTFLQGLRQAINDCPWLADIVCAHFVGELDHETTETIVALGLQPWVTTPGYVSHPRSVGYLCQADVLVIIVRMFPNVVPGKVYEYLGARKPVLALTSHDGETLELLRKAGLAFWADPENPEEIARQIIRLADMWKQGTLQVQPNEAFIRSHTRQQLTGRLAEILDAVSLAERAGPRDTP